MNGKMHAKNEFTFEFKQLKRINEKKWETNHGN